MRIRLVVLGRPLLVQHVLSALGVGPHRIAGEFRNTDDLVAAVPEQRLESQASASRCVRCRATGNCIVTTMTGCSMLPTANMLVVVPSDRIAARERAKPWWPSCDEPSQGFRSQVYLRWGGAAMAIEEV